MCYKNPHIHSLTVPSRLRLTHQQHKHTQPFNGPFSGTTWVSQYQKGKTNLDFTEASDSEWQWHQLGHMQVCTSLQTDNHASSQPLSFLQARCPSCCPTNSIKAQKANASTSCYINGSKRPHHHVLPLACMLGHAKDAPKSVPSYKIKLAISSKWWL